MQVSKYRIQERVAMMVVTRSRARRDSIIVPSVEDAMRAIPKIAKKQVRHKSMGAKAIREKQWGKLPHEVLVSIFQLLTPMSILCGASQCCSQWYQASKDPNCWQVLDFSDYRIKFPDSIEELEIEYKKFHQLFMFCIEMRSRGSTTKIYFPPGVLQKEKDISYIASRCPKLQYFSLSLGREFHYVDERRVCKAISTLKDLEGIDVDEFFLSKRVLKSIADNCAKFTYMKVRDLHVRDESHLFSCPLPSGLRTLDIRGAKIMSWFPFMCLFLEDCKQLRSMDVSHSRCYERDLQGIMEMEYLEEYRYDDLVNMETTGKWYMPSSSEDEST